MEELREILVKAEGNNNEERPDGSTEQKESKHGDEKEIAAASALSIEQLLRQRLEAKYGGVTAVWRKVSVSVCLPLHSSAGNTRIYPPLCSYSPPGSITRCHCR